ncbi:MAG: hypothetical protein ACKV22_39040 [Bryobacteraceae bacterium]
MRLLLCLGLAVCSLCAQDRSRRWGEDLDTLERELSSRHPRLREGELREDLARRIAEIRVTVENSTDQRLAIAIARLLAGLNEAHTNLTLGSSGVAFARLPLALRWFSDGLFISAAVEPHTRLIGARVVRIGEASVEGALAAVRPFISTENDQWAREMSQTYLLLPDLLEAAGLITGTATVPLGLVNRAGEEVVVDISPAAGIFLAGPLRTYRPDPLYLRNPTYNYWFDFLPDSRTLYIKYNQCVEISSIPWAAFLAEMNEVASAWPVERLVIDLRHNSGGSTRFLRELLALYRQTIGSGIVSFPKGGYGIIGKRTASSAVLNAIDLKDAGFTIVGEPTGGKPSSWGEVQNFSLPNSRLTIIVPTRFVTIAGHDEVSFPPDLAVDFPASVWLAGRDAYLDAILNR